jgi:hypothetical protein
MTDDLLKRNTIATCPRHTTFYHTSGVNSPRHTTLIIILSTILLYETTSIYGKFDG